jgi:arylsulfatase A-like enzyme
VRTVFILFDSLNRHLLGPYGGTRIPTPNFDRLAARAVTFERHYAGSLPCMPARRDIQTGRLSFLHRSWGPLEPFDNSFPELLAKAGVYSHLVTDHHHYFEDGGATYHNRYDSYEFVRGQEGDRWKAMVQPLWERLREKYDARQFSTDRRNYRMNNVVNREFVRAEEDFPSVQCFTRGLEFIALNRHADDWLLQIETFDPHEPFHAPARFKDAFRTGWNGPVLDWPRYGRVEELPEECEELRANYYATVALCDDLLGRVLDAFDRHGMWKDTALVVSTDHGFLLGEHDFWAKNRMTMYEEIVHIPLFVHDPRRADRAGKRSRTLTQTVDMAPTFLDLHGVACQPEMQGHSLLSALDDGITLRDGALLGYFGGAVNVVDGRYTYHRYPPDLATQEVYQYTVMPTHMRDFFSTYELSLAEMVDPFSFTKGARLMKIPLTLKSPMYNNPGPGSIIEKETRLFDLASDPGQIQPLNDPAAEARMLGLMRALMIENEAPVEAFSRIGLGAP